MHEVPLLNTKCQFSIIYDTELPFKIFEKQSAIPLYFASDPATCSLVFTTSAGVTVAADKVPKNEKFHIFVTNLLHIHKRKTKVM
jgi:hypothetical protein